MWLKIQFNLLLSILAKHHKQLANKIRLILNKQQKQIVQCQDLITIVLIIMKETHPTPEDEIWILRVITDNYRYRLELSPYDTYQKVLDKIVQKTGYDLNTIEVCNNNGKRLNIQPQRKLKDVVYLNHGAILLVKQLDSLKNSAMKSRASFLSADTKTSGKFAQTSEKKFFSPQKIKCTHPPNGRCLQCLPQDPKKQIQPNQFQDLKKGESKQLYNQCAHGPNIKCLKCFDKPNKPPEKEKVAQKIVLSSQVKTLKKNVPENPQVIKCKHSRKIPCPRCIVTPKKMTKITLLNPQKSPRSSQKDSRLLPNLPVSPKKSKKQIKQQQPKPVKKCDHGPNAKCLNCITMEKQLKREIIQLCEHSPNAKCLKCLSKDSPKPAHIPFDQYLSTRHLNCQQSKGKTCPNCLPIKNLRLKIDKNCKKHAPYPKSLCTSCMPDNISIKRQEYRHVDYVQFMNHDQIQNFIDFWIKQKGKKQMRVGFLYGYYAEDPYYKNGIRAVVEALYEPHQQCTDKLFWITDNPKRKYELQMLINNLGLQKIGFVMTTNNPQMPFNDAYIRFLSKMQQENSVAHQTGYRLSNMFSMVIGEKIKDGVTTIQPQIYMVSDQGQALQTAGLFISNKQNPYKMKIITETPEGQLLPSVYLNGKEVKQFKIQYLLVKIAAGRDKQSKFAILKNNQFLTSSRGSIKGRKLGQYLIKTKRLPNNARFGDLNLLIFISQTLGIETALQIANNVAQQKQIEESIWSLVERQLSKYI